MRRSLSRRGLLLAAPAIILASALERNAWAQSDPRWAADVDDAVILISVRPGVRPEDVQALLNRHAAHLKEHYAFASPGDWSVAVPQGSVVDVANELLASGLVSSVDPSALRYNQAVPNDSAYPFQSWPATLHCEQVWDWFQLVDFSSAPLVYDIDTGVRGTYSGGVFSPTHRDITSAVVDDTWSIINNNKNVTDTNGHGTNVFSVMCGVPNNLFDTTSIGWGGSGVPIQASTTNAYSEANLISAMNWILANKTGPGFVNNSYAGGVGASQTYINACIALWQAGFMSFGATGDGGTSPCQHGPCDVPAPYMFGVSAINSLFQRAPYANYGPSGAVGGVGTNIVVFGGDLTKTPADGFWVANGTSNTGTTNLQGTSLSSPVACAVARFLKTVAPWLTNQHIYDVMTDQSIAVATTGFGASPIKAMDFLAVLRAVQSAGPVSIGL